MNGKKYRSFFRIRFLNGLQYRTAALSGILTQFAWGFLMISMFRAFSRSAPESFPMEFSQLSSYVWLNQALLTLFMVWQFEQDIFTSITQGNVAYELCRPFDLYANWFLKSAAGRISKAVLRCFPVLFFSFFLPEPFGLSLPSSPIHFLFFLVSGFFSVLVVVSLVMIVYILTFFTMSSTGIRIAFTTLGDFLSGGILPLPFFPEQIKWIVELLPFACIQDVPLRAFIGDITGTEFLFRLSLQIFWACVLILGGRRLMKTALQHGVVQGG